MCIREIFLLNLFKNQNILILSVRLRPCSHLTTTFAFFFDIRRRMEMLSICCHRIFDANAEVKCEQSLTMSGSCEFIWSS